MILVYNQTALESLNQLVWLNTPKHKFHGYKRVYIAAALAMLQFESGPFAYVAIRNHLGLPPSSEQTEEKMAQLVKTWVFHAQKKLKKAKKLFDDKVDAAKAVPASAEKDESGYIPGVCECPVPSGLSDLPQVQVFEGSFVAVANPVGLEVACVLRIWALNLLQSLSATMKSILLGTTSQYIPGTLRSPLAGTVFSWSLAIPLLNLKGFAQFGN